MAKKKKNKTIADILLEHKDLEVPHSAVCAFGQQSKFILLAGDQASFGEDFMTLPELREVIEFYVKQLNGEVNWK